MFYICVNLKVEIMNYRFIKIRNKRLNMTYDNWFLYCDSIGILNEHTEKYMAKTIGDGIKDYFHPNKEHTNNWAKAIQIISKIKQLAHTILRKKLMTHIVDSEKPAFEKPLNHITIKES